MASRRPRAAAGNNTSSAALRGALLIGVAVILGAVLLAQGFSDGSSTATSNSNTSTTVKRNSASTTATTAPQPHDPATVKVLVLNGSGKSGIAKAGADQLKAANYTTLDPANSANGAVIATSVVYFQPGFDADAQQIAAKLGLAPTAAQPLPAPPPPEVGDPKDANVVVVIGTDAPVAGGAGAGGTTATTAAN